ncbi:hypothetical protein CFN78_17000 [Amycolatopsis antarctica]|uniref:Uncharacterized protein n=1 Tax=Amycolatopsis antarctica TaxID=1854586 RepID=A0A263D4C3_9PSEU|nr:hypothetical protein [Amycolatopsis antarctica]OZM72215.1 hypothetical protein CFN78_17000 [Amycolatopsis antarctica]
MSFGRSSGIDTRAGVTIDGATKLQCHLDGSGFVDLSWSTESVLPVAEFELSLSREALAEFVRQGCEALVVLNRWDDCDPDNIGEVRIFDDAPTQVCPPVSPGATGDAGNRARQAPRTDARAAAGEQTYPERDRQNKQQKGNR